MLKQRVLTALIGLPILLVVLWLGPKPLLASIFIVFVALSTYETATMLLAKFEAVFTQNISDNLTQLVLKNKPLVLFAVIMSVAVFWLSAMAPVGTERGMLVVGLMAMLAAGMFHLAPIELLMARACSFLMTICYAMLPWLAMWDLYLKRDGSGYIMLMLAVVWGGDTGAYFGGKRFGKVKLAPTISPKKTREGAVAGLLASMAGGLAINFVYFVVGNPLGSWTQILVVSFFGGIFGQLGDLAESILKRYAGLKDSGTLLPGHGGFLDRADGLLFAAPIIWFILNCFPL